MSVRRKYGDPVLLNWNWNSVVVDVRAEHPNRTCQKVSSMFAHPTLNSFVISLIEVVHGPVYAAFDWKYRLRNRLGPSVAKLYTRREVYLMTNYLNVDIQSKHVQCTICRHACACILLNFSMMSRWKTIFAHELGICWNLSVKNGWIRNWWNEWNLETTQIKPEFGNFAFLQAMNENWDSVSWLDGKYQFGHAYMHLQVASCHRFRAKMR